MVMRMTIRMFIGTTQVFNALNDVWILYIQHFEHFLSTYKTENDEKKCYLLLALIGALMYKLQTFIELYASRKPEDSRSFDNQIGMIGISANISMLFISVSLCALVYYFQ